MGGGGGKGGGKNNPGGSGSPNSTYETSDRVVARPVYTFKWGETGTVVGDPPVPVPEPVWPTTPGAEITVGGITYRAMRARRIRGSVRTALSRVNIVSKSAALAPYPSSFFRYGILTWLSGENSGVAQEVMTHVNDVHPTFEFFEAAPFPIVQGDTFEVVQGCAKTRAACRHLDNINNHRGFPDMPTEEKVLETPDISAMGTAKKDSGGKGGGKGGGDR